MDGQRAGAILGKGLGIQIHYFTGKIKIGQIYAIQEGVSPNDPDGGACHHFFRVGSMEGVGHDGQDTLTINVGGNLVFPIGGSR